MPSAAVLALGFHARRHQAQIDAFLNANKLTYIEEDWDFEEGPDYDKLKAALTGAHRQALLKMGFKERGPLGPQLKNTMEMLTFETPKGVREFAPISLDYLIDTEADEEPEEYVLGIAISGRYYPTFADWEDRSGGLSPMVFDDELHRVMEIIKAEIVKVIPEFQDAVWIVKELWY